MIRHAGQVSLPGGVLDELEDPTQCALREAWEEVGIEPQSVEVLGRLTPIVIPISSFEVETIVGWIPSTPTYQPREGEVIRIVRGDPDQLAAEGTVRHVERNRDGRSLRFPAYAVEGETVWGATALILSEFLEIWRGFRSAESPPPEN
jgi:8-oxo-dGTP pyrophosphatase MutT (NUDIX family)